MFSKLYSSSFSKLEPGITVMKHYKKINTEETKIFSVTFFTGTPADLVKLYYDKTFVFLKLYFSYFSKLEPGITVKKYLKKKKYKGNKNFLSNFLHRYTRGFAQILIRQKITCFRNYILLLFLN